MVNEDRLLKYFLSLAAMNTPTKREKAVADVLEADLRALGFEVVRDNSGEIVGSDTGNVIARKAGSVPGAPPIMFSAHMDTVADTEGWGYVIEDGVIRSKGNTILGSDDKAGVAAVVEAMCVVVEDSIPHGEIEIVFSIAEETGLFGARYLDLSTIKSKSVFVYDGGRPTGSVTVSAPSHDNFVAKIHGKASHAGASPEDGISAIAVAALAISRMKLGRIDRETTANIGTIQGGTARNIIPEFCEVRGEARSRSNEKLDVQTESMMNEFRRAAEEMGATVELSVERSYSAFRLTTDDEVVRIGVEAARRVGIEPELHETGGGSDASVFNAKGLPAAVIGVGYDKPHSVEEYLPVADLVKSTEMAVAIVQVAAGD